MSFTFRNAQKATATGATSLTITKPTGLAVGDLMVAVIGKDDDPAITGPGDWTEVRGGTGTITGNDHSWWLGYKVADAGDVAASNFQWSGDSEDWSGTIAAFIPSNSNPAHVATSTAVLRENDATPISNAITAATAGSLLIGGAVAAQADTGGLGAQTSGYTVAASPAPTTGTGNGDNGSVLAYKLSATGGETTFEANNAESVAESHAFIMEFSDNAATEYDETGRSVSITATITATDGWYYDETGLTTSITATVTATDDYTEAPPATFGQIAARAYTDGDEADAVMVGTDNTPTLKVGELYHLRFEIEESAGVAGTFTGQLERQLNSGSWVDVSTSSTVLQAIKGWTLDQRNSQTTTNRLDTSAKTFTAAVATGTGLAASVAMNNQSTNLVYTVYIPAGDVTHGDTINVRVRNTHADGDPSYTQILTATVAKTLTLPGIMQAEARISVESHGFVGPIMDSDGNLYFFSEVGDAEGNTTYGRGNPIPVAWKSENGGKSWRTVQGYDHDSVRDLEALSVSRTDPVTTGEVLIAKQSYTSGAVQMYPYHTGDHATTPDTFETYETVTMYTQTGYDDNVVILERSDGDRVIVGGALNTTEVVQYNWHNGTAWQGVAQLSTGTDIYLTPRASSCTAADRTVVVWVDETNHDVYMRAFNAAGTAIGSQQQLNTLAAYTDSNEENIVVDVVCYDDTNDYHLAVWKSADGTLYSSTIKWNGTDAYTVGSEAQVSTTAVDGDHPTGNDSEGPTAAVAVDEANGYVYAVYARASDTDLYYNFWSESGGWDTETSLYVSSGNTDTIGYVGAQVFTHSAANGGERVLGYVYTLFDISAGEADPNLSYGNAEYNEVAVETSSIDETGRTVAITATVTGTDQADFTDDVATSIAATIAATDDRTLTDENVSVAITSSVAATDDHNLYYDETGRTVSVAATVTASDVQHYAVDGLTVAVTASVAATDDRTLTDENVVVAIIATVDATDVEPGVNYDETGRLVEITATVAATDDHNIAYDETGRVVAIAATVTATDDRTLTAENVTVAATSNVTSSDTADYTDAVTVAVTAAVFGSDQLTTPGAYEEDVSVAIAATVTGTDTADVSDALTVAVTGAVAATDAWATSEDVSVAISSSVAPTDQFDATEAVAVAVVGSTAASDVVSSVEALSVPVTATVNATDIYDTAGPFVENVVVAIIASVYKTEAYTQFREPSIHQAGFRFKNGAADLNEELWLAGLDVDLTDFSDTVPVTLGLRLIVENIGDGAMPSTGDYQLQHRVNDGTWTPITSGAIQSAWASYSYGDPTTQLIGTGTFTTGMGVSGTAKSDAENIALPAGNETEIEWYLETVPSFIDPGDVIDFRVVWRQDAEAWRDPVVDSTPTINIANAAYVENVSVPIIAAVVATDGKGVTESAVVSFVANVLLPHNEQWTRYENPLVAITSSVASTDIFTLGEILSIEITSTIVADDTGAFIDATVIPIQATVGSWDNWYMLLEHDTAGIGTASGETEPNRAVSDDKLGDAVGGERGTATSNLPRPGRVT